MDSIFKDTLSRKKERISFSCIVFTNYCFEAINIFLAKPLVLTVIQWEKCNKNNIRRESANGTKESLALLIRVVNDCKTDSFLEKALIALFFCACTIYLYKKLGSRLRQRLGASLSDFGVQLMDQCSSFFLVFLEMTRFEKPLVLSVMMMQGIIEICMVEN